MSDKKILIEYQGIKTVGGVYQLPEHQTLYGDAEKSDINPDNDFPWNITSERRNQMSYIFVHCLKRKVLHPGTGSV